MTAHRQASRPEQAAGAAIQAVTALAERGLNVVTALLDGQPALCEQHYPAGDEVDPHSRCRYYYHSHSGRPWQRREHGHFHLFTESDTGFHHLVALSVDAQGLPVRGFTTNRWVTGEQWVAASQLGPALAGFALRESGPRAAVNRWVNAMVGLFQPQLQAAIRARDARLMHEVAKGRDPERFLEDRRTHVLSATRISLLERLDALA